MCRLYLMMRTIPLARQPQHGITHVVLLHNGQLGFVLDLTIQNTRNRVLDALPCWLIGLMNARIDCTYRSALPISGDTSENHFPDEESPLLRLSLKPNV